MERRQLDDDLRTARERAERAERLVMRCESALTERELQRLNARLAEIDRLASALPDGDPPPAPEEGPDVGMARELREAAFEYSRRPDVLGALEGPDAGEMARELAALPESAEGDRDVAPVVAEAASSWRRAAESRAVREQLGPGDAPATAISQEDAPIARHALAALESPPPEPTSELEQRLSELREEQARHRRALEANSGFGRWPWIGALAGTLVGFLGFLELLPRLVGVAGYAIAVVCFVLIYRAQRRTPSPSLAEQRERGGEMGDAHWDLMDLKRRHKVHHARLDRAARDLAALGLEPDPDAVRNALDDLRKREAWHWDNVTWQQRVESAREDEAAAERALRAALAGRGVEDPDAPAASLLDEYERACRRNLALASGTDRREALHARIEARQQLEAAAAGQRARREEAEARFHKALAAAGFPTDSTEDPERWAARWLEQRGHRLSQMRSNWSRLQSLLDGRTREAIAAERESTAVRLSALDSGEKDGEVTDGREAGSIPVLQELDAAELGRKLAGARNEAVAAGNEVSNCEGRLAAEANLPSLAELEEECAAAESEVGLLRRAADILQTTQEHLEAAQDKVHRMLAPDLREALAERLSLVTDGRYSAVRIDPEEGLEVQLEVEDGVYRSASELSHGTVDQVYLLLRIALAESLGDRTESAPLFLDDATVHCDTDRTIRFLDLLLKLSEERQIVVFSQEEEVRAWAAARLAAQPRHGLIELDGSGLPVGDPVGAEPTAGSGPPADPDQQHSLL